MSPAMASMQALDSANISAGNLPLPHTGPAETGSLDASRYSHLKTTLDGFGFGRPLPWKNFPDLPRPATFRRQDSEQRERLIPSESTRSKKKNATKIGPVGRQSLPAEAVPDKSTESECAVIDNADDSVRGNYFINEDATIGNDTSAQEALNEEIQHELETKWILNLSMHFGDKSSREKFFLTYAEAPTKWRNVTVSCDYRDATPDSLEQDLKTLQNQRDKHKAIYEDIRDSLPDIQFYNTITNLKLETRGGRLHVHVTEDVNERDWTPFNFRDFKASIGPESQIRLRNSEDVARKEWKHMDEFELEQKSLIDLKSTTAYSSNRSEQKQLQNRIKKRTMIELMRFFDEPAQKSHLVKLKQGLVGFANGANIAAMADTGSRENMISASYAQKLGLKVEESPSSFKIGNAQKIRSLGTVSLLWAFAENPKESVSILCHVLPRCTYDLILGNGFLRATETMSKFRHRLTKCLFSVMNNVSHFGFLGETYQRLQGTIADTHPVFAIPDTGADRNVMSWQYAIDNGLEIKTGSKNRGYFQFADGSFDKTVGQVETYWTFASGERIPVTFEILQYCCSDVIIGEDILTEHNVFQEHAGSILLDTAFDDDSYELAPFDFINSWQRGCERIVGKIAAKKDSTRRKTLAVDAYVEEQRRRNAWNHKYDFGACATTGEKELELVRRECYKASHQSDTIQRGAHQSWSSDAALHRRTQRDHWHHNSGCQ